MGFNYLEHATDALIEVEASNLIEAFNFAGQAVINTTLDITAVQEKEKITFSVTGKNLQHLLFNWLEEINFLLITKGFAIHRLELNFTENKENTILGTAFGEKLDLKKHHFKVEIKAPTFHMMKIKENAKVYFRFLLDL